MALTPWKHDYDDELFLRNIDCQRSWRSLSYRNQSIDLFCKSLICSANHWTGFYMIGISHILDIGRAGFDSTQNLNSDFVEKWSCDVALTTTPRHHKIFQRFSDVCRWDLKREHMKKMSYDYTYYNFHIQSPLPFSQNWY